MQTQVKYTLQQKLHILELYLTEKKSLQHISDQYNIRKDTLKLWAKYYKENGVSGLKKSDGRRTFSTEFKKEVVSEIIDMGKSIKSTSIKYNIYPVTVKNFLRQYEENGLEECYLNSTKFTKEQMEVIEFCIENSLNYNLTAEKFNMPYHRVYNWVKKYMNAKTMD